MAISWQVPSGTVNNNFSVTLVSDEALKGVEVDDVRLRTSSGNLVRLVQFRNYVTLTQVEGTNNWRFDIALQGTFDTDVFLRLLPNRVEEGGQPAPNANLDSATFHLDSSHVAQNVPDAPSNFSVSTAGVATWTIGGDGGSALIRQEVRHAQGSAIPANTAWVSVDAAATTYTFANLSPATQYTFEIRSVNAVGNSDVASATVTTSADSLTIEPIDDQLILQNTTNYELEIRVTGATEVVVTGDMEGFNQDWQRSRNRVLIASPKVTRLIVDSVWIVTATDGVETKTLEIKYTVVAPTYILEPLPHLNLYRRVETNWDIFIENPPGNVITKSPLLGVKSELNEFGGYHFQGVIPEDVDLGRNTENVKLIVPDPTGTTQTEHDYPYTVKGGNPPMIGDVTQEFLGDAAILEFDNVRDVLNYEWAYEPSDPNVVPTWTQFSDRRPQIDPRRIEIEHGNLSVTIRFPVVTNASAYEYSVGEGENWVRVEPPVANGFATIVIPGLEEGVETRIQLRVASPWIGSPVSVSVIGGRLCVILQNASSGNDSLYLFHTGVVSGGAAQRIKRFFLPSSIQVLSTTSAVALDGDFVYVANSVRNGEKAIYVFNHKLATDGSSPSPIRKHPIESSLITAFSGISGIDVFGDELYVAIVNAGSSKSGIRVFNKTGSDGASLTLRRSGISSAVSRALLNDISVVQQAIIGALMGASSTYTLSRIDPELFIVNTAGGLGTITRFRGLSVVGDSIYVLTQTFLRRYDLNDSNRYVSSYLIRLPGGVTNAYKMDIFV